MKVSELREWLENEPDDADVVVNVGGVYHHSDWMTNPTLGVVSVAAEDEWVRKFTVWATAKIEHEYEVEAVNEDLAEEAAEELMRQAIDSGSIALDGEATIECANAKEV